MIKLGEWFELGLLAGSSGLELSGGLLRLGDVLQCSELQFVIF